MSTLELAAERPVGIREHLVGATRTGAFLLVSIPLGLAGVLALPMLAVGSSLPWRLTMRERRMANAALGARIPQLPDAQSRAARRIALFVPLRLAASLGAAAVALVPIVLVFALALGAAEGLAGTSDRYLGPWTLGPLVGAVLAGLALAAGIVSVAVLDGLRRPLREVARRLLTVVTTGSVAVRETLAESIGDESLAIAYWLPDREAFVDEHGLPVELPAVESGRTWTAVEHEGTPVAAIVHDADLDARPELVRAAAAGAVLALENERLKAALRARVEELRASRARIVEAGIDARRKLERDLHDGAQQHLVALSLDLHMLRARLADEPAELAIVEGSIDKLSSALAELRELARGIHPAILTHSGLDGAITALIERVRLPVDYEIKLGERVSPAAEAAGYFVVLEALTNVLKYARATRASVRVFREPDAIVVQVSDDGVGGADPSGGSGLRGLEDRVAALDGTLAVDSPLGEGTRVTARIPARSA
jgi:signal transduction histidine kinase